MNKTCKICGVEKSVDEFYKDRCMADGYLSKCKRCRNDIENAKQRQKRLQERLLRPVKSASTTHKSCSKCGIDKPMTDFGKDKRSTTGRTSACKVCESVRKLSAYLVDPTPFLERKKRYKALNPEKVRDANSRYKRENLERECAHTTARNARKRRAIPAWETDVLTAEIQWRKDHPGMTLDHIVPVTAPVSVSLGVSRCIAVTARLSVL